MKIFILSIAFLTASFAKAGHLDDLIVSEATPQKGGMKLKVHPKNNPSGSYFFVEVTPEDPKALAKMALVIRKLLEGDKLKLGMKIISFSESPSGSYYRSPDVTFFEGGPEKSIR